MIFSAMMLYPAYFDARKSLQQGRRVPKKLAVNTDLEKDGIPLTCWHLAQACEILQLPVLVEEQKRYTRDYFGHGRVRVRLDRTNTSAKIRTSTLSVI